jgi:hypothetical protein
MKRAAFIAITIGHVLASASPRDAIAIAELSLGNAERRVGEELSNALVLISTSSAAGLDSCYKEALNLVRQGYVRERAGIRSASAMMAGDKGALNDLAKLEESFAAGESVDLARVKAAYRATARAMNVPVRETPVLSSVEQQAAKLYPVRKAGASLGQVRMKAYFDPNAPLKGESLHEALEWADGTRSVLDIRNAVAAEYGPLPTAKVLEFFQQRAQEGLYALDQRGEHGMH